MFVMGIRKISILGVLFLLPLGYGGTYEPASIKISISQEDVEAVRTSPSLIRELFAEQQSYLLHCLQGIGGPTDEASLYIAYCSLIAHRMAPYGGCKEVNLEKLLAAKTLHCGSYAMLTYLLAEAGWPDIFASDRALHFVGWRGGAFSAHSTLFLADGKTTRLFIDPSVGLLATTSFDGLASSRPIPRQRIADGSLEELKGVQAWQYKRVMETLQRGRATPSQIYYYYYSLDSLLEGSYNRRGSKSGHFGTPAMQKRLSGVQ